MRGGHRQLDEHWNCFKGNVGNFRSDGWGGAGAHFGFFVVVVVVVVVVVERIDTVLN